MFQYALGKTLSERHQTSLALDVSSYRDDQLRHYWLGLFNIRAQSGSFPRRGLVRGLGRRLGLPGFTLDLGDVQIPGLTYVVREKAYTFDPSVLEAPDNVYLTGHWQSYKYFMPIEPVIRRTFALGARAENVRDLARRIRSVESVCVNVRRTDYVTDPVTAGGLGFVGLEYYTESMKRIYARVKDPTVFVFSDDLGWCMNNLRFDCPTTFVGHEYAGKGFSEYLYLMTCCKHFVIPNSTFAWWGVWLSDSKGTIVAPKRWFSATLLNDGFKWETVDLIPAGWTQV
jgi:hypothetical protein